MESSRLREELLEARKQAAAAASGYEMLVLQHNEQITRMGEAHAASIAAANAVNAESLASAIQTTSTELRLSMDREMAVERAQFTRSIELTDKHLDWLNKQDEIIKYLEGELARRGAPCDFVSIPKSSVCGDC